jgi:hypothetical protein
LLDFKLLTGSHTGQYMAEILFEITEDMEITEKLFCVTTDGASSNTKMMDSFSRILLERKGIQWDHEEMHINCLDHIINLAVQAFLKSIKVLDSNGRHHDDANSDDEDLQEDEYPVNVIDKAEGFAETLQKLRSLAKVCIQPQQFVTYKL